MPKQRKAKSKGDKVKEGRGLFIKNEYDEVSDKMKEKGNGIYTDTIRDVVILASALAAYKKYEPIEFSTDTKTSTHKVPGSAIKSEHEFYFKILSFWKTKDYNILIDPSKLRVMIEQFANAGFKDLIKIFQESEIPNFELLKIVLES